MNVRAWHRLSYPAVALVFCGALYEFETPTRLLPKEAERIIEQAIANSRRYEVVHGPHEHFDPTEPTTASPISATGAVLPYRIVVTPVVNGGNKPTPEPEISVRLSAYLRPEQSVPAAPFFSSCCEFRAEVLQNSLLRPEDFQSMLEAVLNGYQWVSPSVVPLTDRQIKSLKLVRRIRGHGNKVQV